MSDRRINRKKEIKHTSGNEWVDHGQIESDREIRSEDSKKVDLLIGLW